jgi:diguanylate cyclase (GGDEF)-like protein
MAATGKKQGYGIDGAARACTATNILVVLLIGLSAYLAFYISKQNALLQGGIVSHFQNLCMEAALKNDILPIIAPQQAQLALLGKASLGVFAVMAACVGFGALFILPPAFAHMRKQKSQIGQLASSDALTGLYTRAALMKTARLLMGGALRNKHPLSVLAIDIGGMRAINDAKGRGAGDAAIKAIATALEQELRNSDAVGRVGGQEFAVFLMSTDVRGAAYVAEKVRKTVEDMPFAVDGRTFLLRVSIGTAEMLPAHKTPDALLQTAELALQEAKKNGGNRVTMAQVS